MTPETPTPETDAYIGNDDGTFMTEGEIAMCNFSRCLERERDYARAEIEAMREAITEAHRVLSSSRQFSCVLNTPEEREGKQVESTLAKLKPFITDATPPQP